MIPTGHPLEMNHAFAYCARFFGDVPAVVFEGQSRTHAELYRRGQKLAAGFEALGVRRQDRIAVLSTNSLEFLETYVAGWTAGIIVATVNWRLATPEIAYILGDVSPMVVVVEAQFLPVIEAIREQVPSIREIVVIGGDGHAHRDFETLMAETVADAPSFSASEDDIASLLYTSGTTGRPKGCILGQKEMVFNNHLLGLAQANSLEDRFLCVMPLFHIGAMAVGLVILAKGGTVFLHRQFYPVAVIETLERERITQVLLAPTMVQMVLERPEIEGRDFSALQMVLYSAAPMPTPVLRKGLARFGPVFLQLLGSSEGCSIAYLPRGLHRPEGSETDHRRLLSGGIPFPTVAMRVVDDNGAELPQGEAGELVLKSPVMFRGYWNNSIATSEAVRDGWYHTGDIARFDEDGFVYLVDRKKDMIITGGENVYSREVEEAILKHPAVAEVAVIGLPDEVWGEAVCAVVVPRPGASPSGDEIIEHTRTLIASYKKPRVVHFVTELPKVAAGKVDKKTLRSQIAG